MNERLFRYWGKARPRGDGAAWHPLVYHSLDVAAAGEALLSARPALLQAIAGAAGIAEDEALAWLITAFALHDLGKFSDTFQMKVPHLWDGRARYAAERGTNSPTRDPGHDMTGALLWYARGRAKLQPLGFTRASTAGLHEWVMSACAHHGRPVDRQGDFLRQLIGDTAMADVADYIGEVLDMFRPPATPAPGAAGRLRSSFLAAGVAVIADWLGSNQQWFPYREPDLSLADYWIQARDRAAAAVADNRLGDVPAGSRFEAGDALPPGATATELQAWAAGQAFSRPTLIFLEDLTGSGKTEAALILAHRLMAAGLAEGLYWALPTMATADGLYERLGSAYRRLFAEGAQPSLVLAHGARDLHGAFLRSIAEPGGADERFPGREDDLLPEGTASATCAAWIADDRRTAFLAQVGVGTIDQALLGILPVKHQFLRLTALARRVLVVDEAHAFDAYQNRLLEHLLKAQAALGGSAIVLSATLALGQRQSLANAFQSGLTAPAVRTREPAFPLATVVDAGGVAERAMAGADRRRRDLPILRLDSPEQASASLLRCAGSGACAVWIRNTVQDVMDAAQALRSGGAEPLVFHARFALADRLERQAEVLALFGKPSTEAERRGRLLLATQVVEQSLDLDFDEMISDLAPIDLLIQRAGRLRRHDHRPPRRTPVLSILGPAAIGDPDHDWYASVFEHGQWVYRDHGRLWLTQRTLDSSGGLSLLSRSPRHFIEAVYGEESEAAVADGLRKRTRDAAGEALGHRSMGALNGLDIDKGLSDSAGAWGSEDVTPTRLGPESLTCRLARWDGRALTPWATDADPRHAWRMSEISLRANKVAECLPPDPACATAMEATIAGWPERRYPPLLLPLVEQGGGMWGGYVANVRGERFRIDYDRRDGLRFSPA